MVLKNGQKIKESQMNPYRNNLDIKSSFKKRSILKTLNWKIRIKMRKIINWFPDTISNITSWMKKSQDMIYGGLGIILTFLIFGSFVWAFVWSLEEGAKHNEELFKQEQEAKTKALKEKEDSIQREKDLIKAIEENNRLLKESKNK